MLEACLHKDLRIWYRMYFYMVNKLEITFVEV